MEFYFWTAGHLVFPKCFPAAGHVDTAETYTVRKSIKCYAIYVNLTTFLYTAPEKIVFLILKIV